MKLRTLATTGLFALATATAALPALAQSDQGPTGQAQAGQHPPSQPNAPMQNAPMQNAPMTTPDVDANGVPTYTTWQTDWTNHQYDKKHVILGTVADFKPFRLHVSRPDGPTQTIDLKQGTTILPSGMTPMPNQQVAIVGYYSNGTFIANRVILQK